MRRLALSVALLAHSLIFEYSNIPFIMTYKTMTIITQGEEDCIVFNNSSKNLALYHVKITSQIENFLSYGASGN